MFTFERVIQAAINSMTRGNKAPHCWRAWVQGKGYVNDGSAEFDRADYLRQLERAAKSEAENMGYAPQWAHPNAENQPKKGIVWANWNVFPRGLDTILERMGFEVVWSDQTAQCDGCGGAIHTDPDPYSGKCTYVIERSAFVCLACAEETDDDEETDEE